MDDTPDIQFPCTCHVRVIALEDVSLENSLRLVVRAFGFPDTLQRENRSASGKYVSFSISLVMPDRATMNRFDAALAAVPGVKMVL